MTLHGVGGGWFCLCDFERTFVSVTLFCHHAGQTGKFGGGLKIFIG